MPTIGITIQQKRENYMSRKNRKTKIEEIAVESITVAVAVEPTAVEPATTATEQAAVEQAIAVEATIEPTTVELATTEPPTTIPTPKPSRIRAVYQNNVRRPIRGLCADAWAQFETEAEKIGGLENLTILRVRELAVEVGANINNHEIEFYGCRKFHGIMGRKPKPAAANPISDASPAAANSA